MPILTSGSTVQVGDLLVDLGDLEFNRDRAMKVHTLDGWWDTVPVESLMAATGGPGAVATGPWLPKERYLTVAGHTVGLEPFEMRRVLLGQFPRDVDSPVTVLYPDGRTERMWVRPYDSFELVPKGNQLRFVLPLVALDPWKYSSDPLAGEIGVFTGQQWFGEYVLSGTRWVREYVLVAGRWVRGYAQAEPAGTYPTSLTLTSAGDVASSRVSATIVGPLTAGDWWLTNESTGERVWVEVSVTADQSLVLDTTARTARLSGAPVDHLVFGDYLTLASGGNTFRLVSGTATDAYASIEALPAYQ